MQTTLPAPSQVTTSAVDDAIMRVLAAEQAARAEVRQCEADAERVRQAARAQVRRIAERGAERVVRVHRVVDDSIRIRIEQLQRQRAALLQATLATADEPERIARALDRLAAELSEAAP